MLSLGDPPPEADSGIWSTSGQYASYWNAFLFIKRKLPINDPIKFWLSITGLVAPLVAQRLMGKTGELIVIILLLMAVTSTGASEIIAVTSILVYDVYQLYVKV